MQSFVIITANLHFMMLPRCLMPIERSLILKSKRKSEEVQNDCTEALNLDHRYIKAYSPHSTTTKELGKLKESIQGSGNTDFISTKMNLVNCPDVQTLNPMPSAGSSGQVNTKVSNIQKKRRHSEQAVENPLPPPAKLNITSFDRIPHLMVDSAAEIDILAIVLRCGPKKMPVAVITGVEKLPFVTISRSACNPRKKYRNLYLSRAKENKTMLLSCPSEKTSTSSSTTPMIVTTTGQQLLSITEISSAPSMGVFYVEAKIAVLDEFQDFCVLECSGCKQKKRTEDRKNFECPKCNQKTALVPRCSFQIDLIDNTATTTTFISAELGEKLLSMTAEDIFDITCTKRQSLSLNHVYEMLSNKVFAIQLRKSSWASSNTTHATLSIFSYMEKQHTPQTTTDRTSKKIKPLEISEVEVMATTTAAGSSNAPPKFEPPTPTKKV
ncbi:hypothetical protein KY285_034597 [Solanum tuberosum]|nr:hypothetical protein KY285_034597 [Solanum tuberosum]